jgi:hypothetical protein
MSERISEELFDRFRDSHWPAFFSAKALAARTEGATTVEPESLRAYEAHLLLIPKEDEERQMLEDMGIIEDEIVEPGRWGRPSERQDGIYEILAKYRSRFSEFGREVIMACENLYTPEEHASANEAAKPELERLEAEIDAMLADL